MSERNPEPIKPGMKIYPYDHVRRCVYELDRGQWFAYVQHDCLRGSPTHQKLMMRDGAWRGAMKAFIRNYGSEGKKDLLERKEIDYLKVIRISISKRSIITKAYFQ